MNVLLDSLTVTFNHIFEIGFHPLQHVQNEAGVGIDGILNPSVTGVVVGVRLNGSKTTDTKLLGYDDGLDNIHGEEDRISKRKNSDEVFRTEE
jgi:hypothetical protein